MVKVDEDIQVSEDPLKKEVQEAERWGVYYSNIIPVLINGIQEQQKQIEDLKEENRSLKKRLLDLEERVEKLEEEE